MRLPILPSGVGRLLPARGQGRKPPVRRIHDQRRSPGADGPGSPVQPEIVVEAGCSVLPPVHLVADRRSLGGASQQTGVPVDPFLFEIRGLLLGQELSIGQLLGPLQGRDGAKIPDSPQIRLAPWRPERRWGVGGLGDSQHWRQRHDREHSEHSSETSIAHLTLLLALSVLVQDTAKRSESPGGQFCWLSVADASRRRSCTVPGTPNRVSAPNSSRSMAVSGQL